MGKGIFLIFTMVAAALSIVPVTAQDSNAAAPANATAVAPQPTDKEMAVLKHCAMLTATQRAQSSKCVGLMKKYNIKDEGQGDPLDSGD